MRPLYVRYIIYFLLWPIASTGMAWENPTKEHGGYSVYIDELVPAFLSGRVLFIDTREPEEFVESHIPFAINIPIRDAWSADISSFDGYDYLVPYCLKDFRAFEVLKAMESRGLSNLFLMEPRGYRGWTSLNLPVATKTQSDHEAKLLLQQYSVKSEGNRNENKVLVMDDMGR